MRNHHLLFVPATALVLAAPAFAGATVNGTVKAIDSTHLVVTLKDGKNQTIPRGKDTMFMKGSDMVGADQVKAGMMVMIVLGADNKTAAHVMVK